MRKYILFLFLMSGLVFADDTLLLKNQQPNWKVEVVGEYSNGVPLKVEFFTPIPKTKEWEKVKEKVYRSDGTILRESDLKEGTREGTTIAYYPSEKIETIATYRNGKLQGNLRLFDEQGVLREKYQYTNDFLDGSYEIFTKSGSLFERGTFNKGVKEGETVFFADTGETIRKENYLNGVLDGEMTEYYLNGNPRAVWNYYRGLLHGTPKSIAVVKYSPERKVVEEQDFKMGQPWGVHRSYAKDGTVIKEELVTEIPPYQFQDSEEMVSLQTPVQGEQVPLTSTPKPKKNGTHQTNYPNGSKRSLIEYKDGVLNGKKMLWDPEGEVVEEAFYVNGDLNGRYRHREADGSEKLAYYKNNQLHGLFEVTHPPHEFFGQMKALECHYDNGVLEGDLIEYNIAGTKISQIPYQQGLREGKALYFNEKGVLSRTVVFSKDIPEGDAEEFYPNGTLKSKATYTKSFKEGAETHYFDHGAVKSVSHYKNGLLDGPIKEWNIEGRLIFEGNYVNGKRQGIFRHYDENETVTKEITYVDDKRV